MKKFLQKLLGKNPLSTRTADPLAGKRIMLVGGSQQMVDDYQRFLSSAGAEVLLSPSNDQFQMENVNSAVIMAKDNRIDAAIILNQYMNPSAPIKQVASFALAKKLFKVEIPVLAVGDVAPSAFKADGIKKLQSLGITYKPMVEANPTRIVPVLQDLLGISQSPAR